MVRHIGFKFGVKVAEEDIIDCSLRKSLKISLFVDRIVLLRQKNEKQAHCKYKN